MIQKSVADFWIYCTFLVYIVPFCHVFFHLSDAELLEVWVVRNSTKNATSFELFYYNY
eukprot:COSAG06_NODE_2497_length_6757_cov_80.480625_8_plen_58_part_00